MKKILLNKYPVIIFLVLILTSAVFAQMKSSNYKESDFKKEELDLSSLDEKQKSFTLNLLNKNSCSCGCSEGPWANCIINDPKCPYSRPMGASVVKMVKEGKSEDFILGFFAGWEEGNQRKKKKAEDPNKIYPVTTLKADVRGPKDAPVTIIEYIDYQCPYCKKIVTTMDDLLAAYPGKIRFASLNNPLSFHKNAMPAALAAKAAGRQGKFWEMRSLLFDNTGNLTEENFIKLAQQLQLNIEKFNADRNSEELKTEILEEQDQALKNNATGTPAFFINGKKIGGAQPLDVFKGAVDDALAGKRNPSP